MSDPYREAGLAGNPFVVDEADVAAEVWLDRGWSDARISYRTLVQFLGEKGAGKTSHLRHWQKQLGGSHRHVAPGTERLRPPPVKGPAVFWDEADRIPQPVLMWCMRRVATEGGMVVAGTHRDLSVPARWAGLEVTSITLDDITLSDVESWATLRIAAVTIDDAVASAVLGTVPAAGARPTDSTTWRDIGDYLHRWAAVRVAHQTWQPSP